MRGITIISFQKSYSQCLNVFCLLRWMIHRCITHFSFLYINTIVQTLWFLFPLDSALLCLQPALEVLCLTMVTPIKYIGIWILQKQQIFQIGGSSRSISLLNVGWPTLWRQANVKSTSTLLQRAQLLTCMYADMQNTSQAAGKKATDASFRCKGKISRTHRCIATADTLRAATTCKIRIT